MHTLDMEGKTPLHRAAENNHSHILKMFLKEEARSCRNQHNFLHMAALRDESSLAKMLLEAGASAEGKDEDRLLSTMLFLRDLKAQQKYF